jgi:hypothetical protein
MPLRCEQETGSQTDAAPARRRWRPQHGTATVKQEQTARPCAEALGSTASVGNEFLAQCNDMASPLIIRAHRQGPAK